MLKIVLTKLIKNAFSMMLTEKVILWAVKLAVHQTSNKIDDNVVDLLEACYENDSEGMMRSTENLLRSLKD